MLIWTLLYGVFFHRMFAPAPMQGNHQSTPKMCCLQLHVGITCSRRYVSALAGMTAGGGGGGPTAESLLSLLSFRLTVTLIGFTRFQ